MKSQNMFFNNNKIKVEFNHRYLEKSLICRSKKKVIREIKNYFELNGSSYMTIYM